MAKHVGDVVVLLPGITGSVLRKDDKDVWAPTGGAMLNALLSLGRDIKQLKIDEDPIDVETLDGVTAPSLIPDIHLIPGLWKIDGYSRIRTWITQNFDVHQGTNYFEFPYDWRRDNRVHAHRLARESEDWLHTYRNDHAGNPDAKLVLVGHSMGGLISRYFLECLEGWSETRMLVTFGTPYRGSLKALGALANGVEKKFGPLSLNLSELVRSFTSGYQLLPIYPCFDVGDGALVRVTETQAIPNLDPAKAAAALAFHSEISTAVEKHLTDPAYLEKRYDIRPVVGTFQPTAQSALLAGNEVRLLTTREGHDEGGDGTVPRVSATPLEVRHEASAMFAAQQHASLQDDQAVLVQLDGLLTGLEIDTDAVRALPQLELSIDIDDSYRTGEPIAVRAKPQSQTLDPIVARIESNDGNELEHAPLRLADEGWYRGELPPLPAGAYRVTVEGGENIRPVSDVFAVLPAEG